MLARRFGISTLLLLFLGLVCTPIVLAALPASGVRLIVLVNEADSDAIPDVQLLANQGIQVVLLHADRLTNLAHRTELLKQQLSTAMDSEFNANPALKAYMQSNASDEEKTQTLADFTQRSPILRPLMQRLNEMMKHYAAAYPEARAVGELSTKLALQEAPAVVLEDAVGFKVMRGTTNPRLALETAKRRDYDFFKP